MLTYDSNVVSRHSWGRPEAAPHYAFITGTGCTGIWLTDETRALRAR
jgi:hypothetical protein